MDPDFTLEELEEAPSHDSIPPSIPRGGTAPGWDVAWHVCAQTARTLYVQAIGDGRRRSFNLFVYSIPIDGAAPECLTLEELHELACELLPDGAIYSPAPRTAGDAGAFIFEGGSVAHLIQLPGARPGSPAEIAQRIAGQVPT